MTRRFNDLKEALKKHSTHLDLKPHYSVDVITSRTFYKKRDAINHIKKLDTISQKLEVQISLNNLIINSFAINLDALEDSHNLPSKIIGIQQLNAKKFEVFGCEPYIRKSFQILEAQYDVCCGISDFYKNRSEKSISLPAKVLSQSIMRDVSFYRQSI
ncbi:hypothetical protein [Sediminibacter sp. Hel_I_10]|uniref:hypothetical protein n=1 Tax=Sediminibacter sp. Hel_I_10 TaxID=1392490 RepID=UPI0004796A16|nr:hypothetical protein [Sediminibacter sp. Hel_I_10]